MTSRNFRQPLHRITVSLPESVVASLDNAARQLNGSRSAVIRQAIESYLEDCDDLTVAMERLHDPADPVLDWNRTRRGLLDSV